MVFSNKKDEEIPGFVLKHFVKHIQQKQVQKSAQIRIEIYEYEKNSSIKLSRDKNFRVNN